MPKVQYIGTSHYREFSKADWSNVGVEDQSHVGWDRDNRQDRKGFNQVNDVSDAAAKYLMEKEPKGDFKIIEGEESTTESTGSSRRVRDNPQA